jgi:tRNA(Ile)-lysidine synthase
LAQGAGYIALDTQRCSQHPVSVQRHIIRRGILFLRPGLRDIGFNAVEIGVNYLQSAKPHAEIDLISGLKLLTDPGKIWIAEWEAELPPAEWPQVAEEEITLEIGGKVKLQAGWQLSAKKVSKTILQEQKSWENQDNYKVWVDLNQIQLPLLIRARREGDRLQPFGMDGHSLKLSDFIINEKLPRRAREWWPLVCSGEQIVWVCGYRSAHPFRITTTTTEVVEIKLTRIDEDDE